MNLAIKTDQILFNKYLRELTEILSDKSRVTKDFDEGVYCVKKMKEMMENVG